MKMLSSRAAMVRIIIRRSTEPAIALRASNSLFIF